jgi:hypothetical protein
MVAPRGIRPPQSRMCSYAPGGTFDQYVYKWTYFCFIVALILMKIYSQSWSGECINYLFIQSFSTALVTIMYLIA